jgi:SAM-dependent methyltransferase
MQFIGDQLRGRALDVGPRNPFTDLLGARYGIPIDSTEGDLDELELTGMYEVVFHFEVLEHLMNPLFHLRQVRRVLRENGTVYLSTPVGKPHFLWSSYHFHEFHPRELNALLSTAGFSVERQAEFLFHPLRFYFTGMRPLLRLLFERCQIYALRKASR